MKFGVARNSFQYESTEEPVLLVIHTKSPTKWVLLDRETGQTYVGNPGGYWDRLEPVKSKDNE